MGNLILAVDDSRTIRASVKYTLEKAGYEVVLGCDGKEGLDKLNELKHQGKKPDMIISDINMPNMDGISFIKELKNKMEYKFIPVLVLTTESQHQKKMEGKKAGAAGWLVKPFKSQQLVDVVKKFVR
ncbi:response regulator [Caldisalinibacter kiritimatiensis]|uniref:Chemotaxis regulator-transmits chemoreceptor signals to flagelllar motor components CheY n=1 Tax=Caldisalinibacter kiritimatiensis TaxID=1304284 RepID=R1CRC4_9FIRM|nr:response regulator [Caldisalinibacter kiritimatiensis]EOC99263.1 Chemotaxis regulator - transmits chemoreceptor signals to flagelllar motor components CheY [Caldisalinibacter kiritimatiensis]